MGLFSKFIDDTRRAKKTPDNIIDQYGNAEFGTFDSEFKNLDMLNIKGATHLPDALNKLKLTKWQASEVHFEEGLLLSVVCDMGIFGKILNIFYDKRTKQIYSFNTDLKSSDTTIAPNLINDSVSYANTNYGFVKYVNSLDQNTYQLTGKHSDKNGQSIEYYLEMTRISKPSIVSIPFDKNRPLYSQKDFFKASGKIIINGEKLVSTDSSVAILDDHRGYYPRNTHYDWITCLGYDQSNNPVAVNLTVNQSVNPKKYNENLIWFENATSLLPPVTFSRTPESKDFKDMAIWHVTDAHDMVDVTLRVNAMYKMILHAVLVNVDYYIAFGEMTGYVRDENGNKITLDGMIGMGEDKTMLL